ncbi:MAG: hypothetical protein KGJ13_07600 [Patescibacteria group bacterium]|nr:hypothetical protein [Patescibacteria group bacterium]
MRFKLALGLGIMAAAFMAAGFSWAASATAADSGNASPAVTFPIAELGNCSDQASCHAYCNDPANMDACISYAQSHGLENSSEVQQGEQFAKILKNGGGPGGCNSPDACDAYCSSISHMDSCIAFAKAHGLGGDKVAQGEKILNYLQSGGHMPGGCDSQESCSSYCSDESHQAECMAFAQAVGLPQSGPPGSDGAPSPEMQQKFNELLKDGKTPGGCATLQACSSYCNDQSHAAECGSFGEAMGVRGNMRVTRPGPGGCTSDATCKAYCSDPSHAAECRSFGQQNPDANQNQEQQQQPGPGGCTTDASCQAYCNDPSHAAECQAFAEHMGYNIQGSSTSPGPAAGCGQNEYWNGSECVSSGPEQEGGAGSTPPPCPPGQVCNTDMQQNGPAPTSTSLPAPQSLAPLQSYQANLLGVFGDFAQSLARLLGLK